MNFITKDPDLGAFHGRWDLSATTRANFDVSTYIEGPIVEDKLSASLSGRFYDKRGHYTATDGGRLGDEQSWSVNGKVLFQPNDNFSLRLRGAYAEDRDGAPAAGFVSGDFNDSCTGLTLTTNAGETVMPVNYFCGEVPSIQTAVSGYSPMLIDSNTILPANVLADFLSRPLPDGGVPDLEEVGLRRTTTRLSAHANYETDGGYNFDAIFGYHDQGANFIRDFDLTGFDNAWSRDPQAIEDLSAEARVTSPQDQRFRWTIGFNYYEQTFTAGLTGGDFASNCADTGTMPPPVVLACVPGVLLTFGGNNFNQSDESTVYGVFGGADFDIFDTLTLTFEARYQVDKLSKGGASALGLGAGALEAEFKSFLPRTILRWTPNDDTTVYASYALGVVPGDINSQFVGADAMERPQYLAQFPGLADNTPEEKLKNYEIGWKQQFLDGRAQFNLSAFYNEWTGIKGRSTARINETCDASGTNAIGVTGCDPADGIMVGDPKMILNPVTMMLEPLLNARNILIDGDARTWGFEAELGGQIMEGWTADVQVAFADTRYTRYEFNFVSGIAGTSNMKGNRTPRAPRLSGNFSTTYTHSLTDTMDGFARFDLSYLGKTFVDESNLAFIDDYFLANLRVGVELEQVRLEIFVNNLFNYENYITGARWSDFAVPTSFTNGTFVSRQGVAFTAPDKREVGFRASFNF